VRSTKSTPQIAKINKVNGSVVTVNIVWLDGTYGSKWKIWKIGGRIIKDTVPLRAILTEVELSSDMCISKKLKSELDEKYCSAEYVCSGGFRTPFRIPL